MAAPQTATAPAAAMQQPLPSSPAVGASTNGGTGTSSAMLPMSMPAPSQPRPVPSGRSHLVIQTSDSSPRAPSETGTILSRPCSASPPYIFSSSSLLIPRRRIDLALSLTIPVYLHPNTTRLWLVARDYKYKLPRTKPDAVPVLFAPPLSYRPYHSHP